MELTVNGYAFQSAKRLAEHALNNCVKVLKENEEKWNEYMDLKLHSASMMNEFPIEGCKIVLDDNVATDLFYRFCEDSYYQMKEDLKEAYGIDFDVLRDNVGRTSSFYLDKAHNNLKDKYTVALARFSDTFSYSSIETYEDEKRLHIDVDLSLQYHEDVEDLVNSMLEIVEEVEKEFTESFSKIEKTYDYIHDFKENQNENFTEYVKCCIGID